VRAARGKILQGMCFSRGRDTYGMGTSLKKRRAAP